MEDFDGLGVVRVIICTLCIICDLLWVKVKSRYALMHNRPFHFEKVNFFCNFVFLSCTASLISIFSDFINRNADFDQ